MEEDQPQRECGVLFPGSRLFALQSIHPFARYNIKDFNKVSYLVFTTILLNGFIEPILQMMMLELREENDLPYLSSQSFSFQWLLTTRIPKTDLSKRLH